jgi:hypothetical protein
MTLISSRSPGFFKKIVFDKLDAQDLTFKEIAPVPVKHPMEGVEVWKNPLNEFVVVDLHYTANPRKRGTEWKEAVRRSMPIRDFLMEYEKSWQTYEGKPVYEDFNPTLHVVRGTIEPEPGLPLLLGWDFGLTPACVLCQLVGHQLRVLEEFIESDGSILKLAPKVLSHLNVNYPEWGHGIDAKVISFIDPAGSQRSQVDEKTCMQSLRTAGFRKIVPGPVDWESRRQAVEQWLIKVSGKGPAFIVSDEGCPVLIEGFNGGYQYPKNSIEIEPNNIQPVKNKFSHPHDGLQYVCWGATFKQKQYGRSEAPAASTQSAPSYGFQKT